MNRYKLTLEYCGIGFHGWQQQLGLASVQETLQGAATQLMQEPITLYGAGRTDAGVHAWGQVAHLDSSRLWLEERLKRGLNAYLKGFSIVVRDVKKVDTHFHARFSARFRHYTYCITCQRHPLVLTRGQQWLWYRPMNWQAIKEAATFLVGTHDFSCFRSSLCQAKSAIKTLSHISFQPVESCQIESQRMNIHFIAPSFLHHQVRMIMGFLHRVGIGKDLPSALNTILRGSSLKKAPSAPPHALYLTRVLYDDDLPLSHYIKSLGEAVGNPESTSLLEKIVSEEIEN